MQVKVIDGDTLEPVAGSEVEVMYPRHLFDFNVPPSTRATTDTNGMATLRVADYKWTTVQANSPDRSSLNRLELNDSMVRSMPKETGGRTYHTIISFMGETPIAELTVPDGYRGPIKIHFESDESPARGCRRFPFAVDPTGHVAIRGPRILVDGRWGEGPEMVFKYANGETIPSPRSDQPWDLVAFRYIYSGPGSKLYIIGLESDEIAFKEKVDDKRGPNDWVSNPEKYKRFMAE
jgi:hypothetical protein